MKLSVSVVTYQHAATVRQALDGVLRQKTNFPFEVIVGDDASTDGTQQILESIRAEAPQKVRLILRETNAGDMGRTNFMSTIDAAKGDYIALLDGDDFWTDPFKLQKQVDFLDSHPDCALCAHRVEHLHADGVRTLSPPPPGGEGPYDIGTLIVRNFAPKISTVIRSSARATLPDWYRTSTIISGDWLLNVLVGRTGRVGFIDEVMGVHRLHSAGMTLRYGAERMMTDKLAAIEVLRDYMPQASMDLARSERRLRWKLRILRSFPRLFALLKRLDGLARSRPA